MNCEVEKKLILKSSFMYKKQSDKNKTITTTTMPKQFIKLNNGKFIKVDLTKIYMKAVVESTIELEDQHIKFCNQHNREIKPISQKQKMFLIALKTKQKIELKYDFDKNAIVEALYKLETSL